VVQESFLPNLEGVLRATRFTCVLLATALKSLCLTLIVSLSSLLVYYLFINRSVLALAFTRVIILLIVNFKKRKRRLILLYKYLDKY
jgi:hypothetical protein